MREKWKTTRPGLGAAVSTAKRDIAKKLISRLTVCELLYDQRVLLSKISYHLVNKAQIDEIQIFKKHFLKEIRC